MVLPQSLLPCPCLYPYAFPSAPVRGPSFPLCVSDKLKRSLLAAFSVLRIGRVRDFACSLYPTQSSHFLQMIVVQMSHKNAKGKRFSYILTGQVVVSFIMSIGTMC